jgi:hypothetical protein
MANIKVNNLSALNISGADLFNDSESFLTELSDESEKVIGGGYNCVEKTVVACTAIFSLCVPTRSCAKTYE